MVFESFPGSSCRFAIGPSSDLSIVQLPGGLSLPDRDQLAANWFVRHKSIFPYEKVDGQVAGHLAANFSPTGSRPVGRQPFVFAISPYFPRGKLTAKLPATDFVSKSLFLVDCFIRGGVSLHV